MEQYRHRKKRKASKVTTAKLSPKGKGGTSQSKKIKKNHQQKPEIREERIEERGDRKIIENNNIKEQNWWNSQIWIGIICMLEVVHNDQ